MKLQEILPEIQKNPSRGFKRKHWEKFHKASAGGNLNLYTDLYNNSLLADDWELEPEPPHVISLEQIQEAWNETHVFPYSRDDQFEKFIKALGF